MNHTDKAHPVTLVKTLVHAVNMFTTRRTVSLDPHNRLHARRFSDSETEFHVIGHQSINESTRLSTFDQSHHRIEADDQSNHKLKARKVLPPIPGESSAFRPRASSDTHIVSYSHTGLENEHSTSNAHGLVNETSHKRDQTVPVSNHHQFLQTQGYIPGVDSQVTIKHPYVMKNGGGILVNPTIKNAFQRVPSDDVESDIPDSTVTTNNTSTASDKSPKVSIRIPTDTGSDMSDSEYDISTFPPVRKDEISRHSQLNKEAEKNSKNKPHAYQDYLQKLQVQKRLLVKPKQTDPKVVKRKNKKLQFKSTRLRDTREDLFDDKPDTPPKLKPEVIKPMKVIQSFRYSRAIAEYYKGQLGSMHSMTSVEEETNNQDDNEKVENGWLVKSLGPQVLNLYARTLPSCNPIELRLRRQHARQRALEHGRYSKRSSTLSNRSLSQRLSRSHDSFIGQGHGSVHSNKSTGDEALVSSSPVSGQPNKGRFLPDISEVHVESDKTVGSVSGSSSSQQRTSIVLSLPLLTSDS